MDRFSEPWEADRPRLLHATTAATLRGLADRERALRQDYRSIEILD